MKKIRQLAVFNALSLGLHLAFTVLVQTKSINDKDVGEISDQYLSLFTPSGSTFAIWSVIYASLIAFSVYHLYTAWKHDADHPDNRDLEKIGSNFIINNLATAAWLLLWVNDQMIPSAFLILIQLATLIVIHLRLKIHDSSRTQVSKLFTQFPFSLYFGWISIATIANISTCLTAMQWEGWGISDINWTITMIAIAVFVTVNLINRKKNVVFGLVVIWALYGIIEKRNAVDSESFQPIVIVTWGGIGIIALACLFGLVRNLRRR